MLTDHSLFIANKIANRLKDTRIKLTPRAGSPIAMLATSLEAVTSGSLLPNQYLDFIKKDASVYGAHEGCEAIHDEKMEWVVELVTKGVSTDLDVAKNNIKPVIEMVLNDVEADLTEAFSGRDHGYEIIQDELPKFFGNQKIENLFERYKNIPIKPIETLLVFPELAAAEIQRRINTGDEEVNTLLAEIINPEEIESIVDIYNWNFREKGRERVDLNTLLGNSNPSIPVMLYFLTLGLEADMPEGVNASTGPVKLYLQNLRGILGAVIYRNIKHLERKIEEKELIRVVEGSGPERKIHVNKVVYDKFLDEGGSPEALFGAVSGNSSLMFNQLVSNSAKLEKSWAANLEVIRNTNNLNKLSLIIVAIRKSLSNYITELEVIPHGSGGKGEMQKRLTNATRNFFLTDMDKLPCSIKRIVFEVVFPEQTNARFIIDAIDKQACEEGEEKKLATSVTLQLIANWLVKNVEIGRVNESI